MKRILALALFVVTGCGGDEVDPASTLDPSEYLPFAVDASDVVYGERNSQAIVDVVTFCETVPSPFDEVLEGDRRQMALITCAEILEISDALQDL